MYKRILKTLTAALALGIAFPVASAAGMPVSSEIGAAGLIQTQKSAPVVSEKVAGLNLGQLYQRPIVSEKVAGLNLDTQSSAPAVKPASPEGGPWPHEGRPIGWDGRQLASGTSVRITGDSGGQLPPQKLNSVDTGSVATATGSGFDWSDAGIGAGFTFGILLLGTAAVVTLRRRDEGRLAH